MKLLRIFLFLSFALILNNLNSSSNCNAQELIPEPFYNQNGASAFIHYAPDFEIPENYNIIKKAKNDKLLADTVAFWLLDSLGNAYSYFSDRQQPFVYHLASGTLVTIKRGAIDIRDPNHINYQGTNHLDNLFFRSSDDWGRTWAEPVLLFNCKSSLEPTNDRARYPSVHAFESDETMTLVYTSPVTDGTGWQGFLNGIYYQDEPLNAFSDNSRIQVNGKSYGWGTDSNGIPRQTSASGEYGCVSFDPTVCTPP